MPTTQLPPAEALGSLSSAERTAVLDLLFEPSDAMHSLAAMLDGGRSSDGGCFSYGDLIGAIRSELGSWADDGKKKTAELDAVLASHPRLGDKKVDSEQSRAEQAQLQKGEELSRWNALYEATFPGLRYVVFVNGRSRDVIVQDMEARIERGDIQLERHEAIKGMCDIAADRARKLGTVDLTLWRNANRVSQLAESTPG